jgi:hypothetical protein
VNRPGGQRLNHRHPGKLDRSPRRRDCSNSSQTASARCGLRTCSAGQRSLPAEMDLDFLGREPRAFESHRPDVKAIRVRRMQKDQLRAAHTIPPSHSGRQASSRRGNPAGGSVGSRHRQQLNSEFIAALLRDFRHGGPKAIERVRGAQPALTPAANARDHQTNLWRLLASQCAECGLYAGRTTQSRDMPRPRLWRGGYADRHSRTRAWPASAASWAPCCHSVGGSIQARKVLHGCQHLHIGLGSVPGRAGIGAIQGIE